MSFRYLTVGLLLSIAAGTAQEYIISTYAGGASLATPVVALGAPIGTPVAVTVDAADNIYFISLDAVFKLDRDGIVTRIAGNSRSGFTGDGGPAVSAQLRVDSWLSPAIGLTAREGHLFIADPGNHRIRKVSSDGIISTIAGNGIKGFSGDGGAAKDAQLNSPAGLAFDEAGNLFIADWGNSRVRKLSAEGIITTVAGVGKCCGSFGDDLPATDAQLGNPTGLAVDSGGNLVIADTSHHRVRMLSPRGIITTIADAGIEPRAGELPYPTGVTIDTADNLFITYSGLGVIRKVSPDGTTTTVAGRRGGGGGEDLGDGGPAADAQLYYPQATTVDGAGNLYIADFLNFRIRMVSPDGTINTVAGGSLPASLGDGGPATGARLALGGGDPWAIGGMAVDGSGNLFIADTNNHRIRKISPDGIITTAAGTGTPGIEGNNGPATEAQLKYPIGVAADRAGNLFIADTEKSYIRKVSTDGIMSIVPGSEGGGAAALALDGGGNLFFMDWGLVRKLSPEGAVSVIAGGGELTGADRDGLPATRANLYWVCGLAVDEAGNVFIADCNDAAHRVSPDGIIHTVELPGGGSPRGVAVDRAGNAYFSKSDSDWDLSGGAEQVFKVAPDGGVTAIAGAGPAGYSGDGGPGASAELAGPAGVAVDRAGNIYFEDIGNGAVRVLRPADRLNAGSEGYRAKSGRTSR